MISICKVLIIGNIIIILLLAIYAFGLCNIHDSYVEKGPTGTFNAGVFLLPACHNFKTTYSYTVLNIP